jgi:hypothetical protein
MAATATALEPDNVFLSEQATAWGRYLRETRGQPWHRYEEVEPWAWQRLRSSLAASRSRLKARTRTPKTSAA